MMTVTENIVITVLLLFFFQAVEVKKLFFLNNVAVEIFLLVVPFPGISGPGIPQP
ncbi:hypothetical protein D9M69_701920 [compost metagenome]